MNQFWQHKCAIKNPTNEVKQQIKKMRIKAGDELEKAIKLTKRPSTTKHTDLPVAKRQRVANPSASCTGDVIQPLWNSLDRQGLLEPVDSEFDNQAFPASTSNWSERAEFGHAPIWSSQASAYDQHGGGNEALWPLLPTILESGNTSMLFTESTALSGPLNNTQTSQLLGL
ncbi:hypothetical protein MGU_08604 [Metarhizium guizhouense ARSEF 977]|uniref:Uncharacterized protein n=1 Tax=Metarhizium guizhouense (strain ARSEF 977) TaxID=1276136 RepID=A0A0B4GBG7_METGA|nr:hypothetical protein MGU_08604 [Metarhizium guizhouense ARSEF 977]